MKIDSSTSKNDEGKSDSKESSDLEELIDGLHSAGGYTLCGAESKTLLGKLFANCQDGRKRRINTVKLFVSDKKYNIKTGTELQENLATNADGSFEIDISAVQDKQRSAIAYQLE